MYDDIGGVWRTVGGRHIFIKNGYDLETAMKESGKFKNSRKKYDDSPVVKAVDQVEDYLYNETGRDVVDEKEIRDFVNNQVLDDDLYDYKATEEEYKELIRRIEKGGYKVKRHEHKKNDDVSTKKNEDVSTKVSKTENPLEKSMKSIDKIDNLANDAQHYTNDFKKFQLEKKGREMGAKDFEKYVNDLKSKSWNNRNSYNQGDVIEYDTNFNGANPDYRHGEVISVSKGLAGHGNTRADNVYLVKDVDNWTEYKIDAKTITKLLQKGRRK